MPIIISFSNHKGGTGKTTSVVNIGCALRDLGKNVLLVDLDPQGNLSYSLGVSDHPYDFVDWINDTENTSNYFIPTEGVYVLPASVNTFTKEDSLRSKSNYNFLLKEKLAHLSFDYILIDCPPAFSLSTSMALTASHYVLIPMLLEVLSIQGLSQVLNFIDHVRLNYNSSLEVIGVLAVCVNESRKLTSEVLEYVENTFKVDVFNNRIHNNVKAAEAPSFAKSVIDYAPDSASAKDYKAVTDELVNKINYSNQQTTVLNY